MPVFVIAVSGIEPAAGLEVQVLIKRHAELIEIEAADRSRLREIFHPDRDRCGTCYSIAHAVVAPGESSLPHALTNREVYYILAGEGTMHVGTDAERVGPGDAVLIPERALQWIENTGTGDLAFLCIVDPPWSGDAELPEKRPLLNE